MLSLTETHGRIVVLIIKDWASILSAGAKLVTAIGGLFGRGVPVQAEPPTEGQLLNQRQEQAAGAARNYSSRRTERAEADKRKAAR
ncbi:hypothetical protein UFOVP650_49 [uncultured Caudovirales phage]|uniref:Uncharacterized protein n=1 Tax=uncultured Caudovirales phage TaxID=2100421 RepID=A0A6J5N7Q1_9CAUD|nr:hypothetical protein UFOVP650_49 [uncultured Caudovirales phage]